MAERPEVICHMLSGVDARVDLAGWCPTKGARREAHIALYFDLQSDFGARTI